MKTVSGKRFARLLKKRGWSLLRVNGSHHYYGHPQKRDYISLPIHGDRDLKIGAQKHAMKIADIRENEL